MTRIRLRPNTAEQHTRGNVSCSHKINSEFRNDKNETENTISINMLKIEEEYEIPIESKCYHNHEKFNNSDKQIITQNETDNAKQELECSSTTNNI